MKKPPAWKNLRERTISRLILSLGVLFLIGLFLLNGILRSTQFGRSLSRPLTTDAPKADLDLGSTVSIMFDTDPPFLLVVSKGRREVFLMSVPSETYVFLSDDRGQVRLGKVTQFGSLDHPREAGQLLKRTAAAFFKVPIDRYVVFKEQKRRVDKEQLKKEFESFTKLGGLKWFLRPDTVSSFLNTDITRFDIISFWWQLKTIDSNEIKFIDLENQGALEDLVLADGSRVKTGRDSRIFEIVGRLFEDQRIVKEGLSIQILNATGYTGLAGEASAIIQNIGGKVVKTANFEQKLENCQILIEEKLENTQTVKRLTQIFDCQIKHSSFYTQLFDVTIILGASNLESV